LIRGAPEPLTGGSSRGQLRLTRLLLRTFKRRARKDGRKDHLTKTGVNPRRGVEGDVRRKEEQQGCKETDEEVEEWSSTQVCSHYLHWDLASETQDKVCVCVCVCVCKRTKEQHMRSSGRVFYHSEPHTGSLEGTVHTLRAVRRNRLAMWCRR